MQDTDPQVPSYGPVTDSAETANPSIEDRIPFETRERILSSANWFFWIAALSAVNSVIAHSGSQWSFIVGLGITQIADAVLGSFDTAGTAAAIVFDLLAGGVFVGIGLLARAYKQWAFVVGMVVYALDGLLFLLVSDYLSIAFHAYALYSIFVGFKLLRESKI
jgi:hypothetical protein